MSTQLTNNNNIPAPIVDAIEFNTFVPAGQISVRRLVDGPQVFYLRRHHNLEEDISDKAWTLMQKCLTQIIANGSISHRMRQAFGTVIGELAARQAQERVHLKDEEREQIIGALIGNLDALLQEWYPPTDRFLIGQSYGVEFEETFTCFKGTDKEFTSTEKTSIFDTIPLYDRETKTLYYTTLCDVAAATKPDMRNSWVRESNLQAYILSTNGYQVDRIEAAMLFKNWTRGRIGNKDYPKSQFEMMTLPIHKNEDVEKLIHLQLKRHLRERNGDVPECLGSERWAEADTWMVRSPGIEKAHRKNLLTEREAVEWAATNRFRFMKAEVIHVPGRSNRCFGYCPVRSVCPQWKKESEAAAKNNAKDEESEGE